MTFITEDFLLQSSEARDLYHGHAAALPIIDFHSHLEARDIAGNRRFKTMTDIWLAGDHYKWRAMRACGVSEEFITGSASAREKFDAWAATVPKTLRNPLYHWTHMELANPFDIHGILLGPETAEQIWEAGNASLCQERFSARGLPMHFNVEVVCTTDDPTDSLEHHQAIAKEDSFPVGVYPTFRPDRALGVQDTSSFRNWILRLREAADSDIGTARDLISSLRKRAGEFHEAGCRLSDHGLDEPYGEEVSTDNAERIFAKAAAGVAPTATEVSLWRSWMVRQLASIYHELGWTQQYHIGPIRNPNSAMLERTGPDTGFDTMGDPPSAGSLCRMLDLQARDACLPRTILYTINPAANDAFATAAGSFSNGGTPGHVQFGTAWWFNDQKTGMEQQLECLSRVGLLSLFAGMVTDSRSFLSYSRHDYFRRILCNMLGDDMRQGLIPRNTDLVGELIRDVCYGNARRFFGFLQYQRKAFS